MPMGGGARPPSIIVWDFPTRISHWAIAGLVLFSWWSATNHHMDWHRASGYAVLFFLSFRIYWGFAGSETARFAHFVRGPHAIAAAWRDIFRRTPPSAPGHNPLGAISVLAMLGALAAQILFGLFSVDVDGIESGPLSDRVDFDTGRVFAHCHHITFTIIEVLVGLHLLAVIYYLVYKRANLIAPMVTGRRVLAGEAPAIAPIWRAVIGAVVCFALAWWVSKGLRV